MNIQAQKVSLQEKPTITGFVLFCLGVSFFLSAIPSFRPRVFGMSAHPYLAVLGVLALLTVFNRPKKKVMNSLGGWGFIFLVTILLSYLANGEMTGSFRQITKWAIMLVTFSLVAYGVRSPADLRWATLGLILGITLIGARALFLYQANPSAYLSPMPGIGSRNNFSLWTLAPFGIALWTFTSVSTTKRTKLLILVSLLFIVAPSALTLSRSTVALLVLNAVLIFLFRRSVSTALVVGILAGAALYAADFFEFGTSIQDRLNTVREGGTESDQVRRDMITHGVRIFLENPVFGVSIDKLGGLLGQAIRAQGGLSSHNLFIDLMAGTGLLGCLSLMMCTLKILSRWAKSVKLTFSSWKDYGSYTPILIMLIAVRGLTSNEVLFCPALIMGLSLCFAASNHAIAEEKSEYSDPQGHPTIESPHPSSGLVPNGLR